MADETRSDRSLTASERETHVWMSDDDDLVHIRTEIRKHVNRIRKDPRFTITREGAIGDTWFLEATIPADRWTPTGGAKRSRNLTEDQRNALRTRLAAARATRNDEGE